MSQVETLVNQAELKFVSRDQKTAFELFAQAIELDPSYAPAYKKRAFCKSMAKNFEEAQKDFAKAIELDENDGETWLLKALSEKDQGKMNEASTSIAKAEELFPDHPLIDRVKADIMVDMVVETGILRKI